MPLRVKKKTKCNSLKLRWDKVFLTVVDSAEHVSLEISTPPLEVHVFRQFFQSRKYEEGRDW